MWTMIKWTLGYKYLNMKPKVLYTQSTQFYWPTNWMNSTSSFLLETLGCRTSKILVWVIFISLVCVYRMFMYLQHDCTWALCSYNQWNMSVYKRGFSDALFLIREGSFEMRSAVAALTLQGFHHECAVTCYMRPFCAKHTHLLRWVVCTSFLAMNVDFKLVHYPVTKYQTEKSLPASVHTYIHTHTHALAVCRV
jgi:hypothetical protein